MFGNLVKRKLGMVVLPLVWRNLYKDTKGKINKDSTKSQGTYNDGPRFCDKSSIVGTYPNNFLGAHLGENAYSLYYINTMYVSHPPRWLTPYANLVHKVRNNEINEKSTV